MKFVYTRYIHDSFENIYILNSYEFYMNLYIRINIYIYIYTYVESKCDNIQKSDEISIYFNQFYERERDLHTFGESR